MPTAQELINMGYTGYQGWDDAGANADFNATGGSGKGSNTSGSTATSSTPQATASIAPQTFASPESDPGGQPPPDGGFQTGGWYSGYQYWNGTFAQQAGVIHPASNQQGAGQTVSSEVNAQGDAAQGLAPGTNQAYIDQQNATNEGGSGTSGASAGVSGASGTGVSGAMGEPQGEVDLTGTYKGLLESSGVSALQDEYLEKERQFIEAKGKINDNPFLSEASRVGREAKITKLFNERTANLQNEIAMKKADVETMMNLHIKQLDMNSEATQRNIDNLNNFIAMGAFDGASGETIAEWTRKTGVSSDLILSAIEANKKGEEPSLHYSENDSGEQFLTVVSSQGDVISQKSLGIGGEDGGGGGSTSGNTESNFMQSAKTIRGKDINGQWWGEFPQLVANYAPYMSLEKIYQLYLKSSLGQQYGTPTEDAGEIKGLYDYYRSGKE